MDSKTGRPGPWVGSGRRARSRCAGLIVCSLFLWEPLALLDPLFEGPFDPLCAPLRLGPRPLGAQDAGEDAANRHLEVDRRPVPAWVREFPSDFARAEPTDEERRAIGGVWYLLSETQENVGSETTFHRRARKVLTSEALGDAATIRVEIDPTYQTLAFHVLRLHRGDDVLDRLPTQSFEMVRTETLRERQIYSGVVEAIAIVEGVEVGDVVEYATTVTGRNPVFEGSFDRRYLTRWSVPVREARLRLSVPLDPPRELAVESINGEFPVTRTVQDGAVEYLWESYNIPPVEFEDRIPDWISPYGLIAVSEFGTWRDVADWASRQYPIPSFLPPALDEKAASIRSLPDDESKVVAALLYVQESVHYVGMFDGVHSHRPHSLGTVVRRGFGDCKDQSLLLCSLLRGVGVDAVPALVHTDYGARIAEWHPSPNSFDHLITCARIGTERYFVDPTWSSQRGPLRSLFLPDYGKALLVEPGTDRLSEVPTQGHEEARTEIFEEFWFDDYRGKARLRVTTAYYGGEADRVRSSFARNSHDEIQDAYLGFYSRSYPEVEATDVIDLEEDPEENRLVVRESYRISGFWAPQEGQDPGWRYAGFDLASTAGVLIAPESRERRFPFQVQHPVDLRQEVWVHLPLPPELPCDSVTVTHPVFDYDFVETLDGTLFTATAHYRSKRDHVLPAEIEEFATSVRAAQARTGFWVSIPEEYREDDLIPAYRFVERVFRDPSVRGTVLGIVGSLALTGIGLGVFFIVLGFKVGRK